jgi:O-acetylserine/cysteine efflux transporter
VKPLDLALLLLINVAWGLNVVPMEWTLEHLPPITAAMVRFAMVFVLCAPALRPVPGQMGLITLTALIAGALMFSLNNGAFALAENINGLAIAGQLGVPFSLILAIVFLGERIRWIRSVGILLAFAGVVVIAYDPTVFDERTALVLSTGGAFAYAVGSVLMRQMRGVPPLTLQAWMALISLPPLIALSFLFEPGAIRALPGVPLEAFGYVLFSALFSSLIGHAGIAYLLQRYPVTTIAPVTLLSPLLAVGFSVWLLDNPLTPLMILGGLVTLVGVAIITLRTAAKETL